MPFRAVEQVIGGFSRRPMVRSRIFRPEWPDELPALLGEVPGSCLPRGAGTAYGDAALNGAGATLDLTLFDRIRALDQEAGTVTCEAGVRLRDLLPVLLARGLFLAVTPGTWKATVGGCVAADAHGKNHHLAGSFGDHVLRLRLALASGRVVECTREQEPELFWATLGGLGLTGAILEAELRLQRVETSWLRARHLRQDHLDATLAALEQPADEPYSVAWLDVLARGRKLGRSVVMLADHAPASALPAEARAAPRALPPLRSARLPCAAPPGLLSAPAVRAFNALYWRRQGARAEPHLVPLRSFFYPLETIDNFPLLFGRGGLLEYQVVLPAREAFRFLPRLLEQLSARGFGTFLCVLKRMRAANPAPMSFPGEGYTIAVDLPFRGEPMLELLRRLDDEVAAAGGRVYLAKDARLSAVHADAMYPRRREWARTLDAWDPERRFASDLSRRLALRET